MKQAIQVKEMSPQTQALIFYKDIRTPGQYEDLYRRTQQQPGVLFTKGEVLSIESFSGKLRLTVDETLIDSHIQVDADLVVLATGMVPVATSWAPERRRAVANGTAQAFSYIRMAAAQPGSRAAPASS